MKITTRTIEPWKDCRQDTNSYKSEHPYLYMDMQLREKSNQRLFVNPDSRTCHLTVQSPSLPLCPLTLRHLISSHPFLATSRLSSNRTIRSYCLSLLPFLFLPYHTYLGPIRYTNRNKRPHNMPHHEHPFPRV